MSDSALWIGPASSSARGVGSMRPSRRSNRRIVEQMAQPVERLAHRRLAEPVVLRRAGDVALRHQRVEDDEQIEVDAPQIPFGYSLHVFLSFPFGG